MASHYEDIRDLLKTNGLKLSIDALRGSSEDLGEFKQLSDILIDGKPYLPFRTHSAIETFHNKVNNDMYNINELVSYILEILSLVL